MVLRPRSDTATAPASPPTKPPKLAKPSASSSGKKDHTGAFETPSRPATSTAAPVISAANCHTTKVPITATDEEKREAKEALSRLLRIKQKELLRLKLAQKEKQLQQLRGRLAERKAQPQSQLTIKASKVVRPVVEQADRHQAVTPSPAATTAPVDMQVRLQELKAKLQHAQNKRITVVEDQANAKRRRLGH